MGFAAGLVLLFTLSPAQADPPARAARLGYTDGQVSFSPAGETTWVQAALNRPLTTGDHLWADVGSRAELQMGGAALRMGASTDVLITNLDDSIAQVQLSQGSLRVRVRQMARNQSFEVDTPNLALSLNQAGDYRIDVDPSGDSTQVTVQTGQAQVYGDNTSYVVNAGQGYRFYSTNLSDYETVGAQAEDELDRWSHDRDRRVASSDSARYVSYEVVGYEDLDANGSWRSDPSYGNVWRPSRVPAGWTPYRDGHWAWIDPWGWSWVDDAPWGYAVSHYGRWAHVNGSWGWIPGPRREQAVYAPALVVFLGGKNFQGSVSVGDSGGAVGWFPLAPREVYQPAYQVSRGYFDRVNRSNAVVSPAIVTNIYNTNVTKTTTINNTTVVYVNQRVPGAVVAVPKAEFTQSHPVAKHTVAVAADAANRANATPVAAVAPTPQSLHGGAPEARVKPPVHDRRFIARTAAPAPAPAFAAQQAQLAEKPGTPMDEQQRKQLKSKAPTEPPRSVTVVPVAKAPLPTSAPPAVAPKGRSPAERKAAETKAMPVPADTSKTEPAKRMPSAPDRARPPASQILATKPEADKANQVKLEADKANQAKADAVKAENLRASAAQAEADKSNAAKANRARDDAKKAEAIKAAATKTEADNANRARADAAKADALKAENARAAAAKAEGERANAAMAKRARDDAAKAESIKAAAAKAEADNANRAKAVADKANALKAENARAAADKANREKVIGEKSKASKKASEPNAPQARASEPR